MASKKANCRVSIQKDHLRRDDREIKRIKNETTVKNIILSRILIPIADPI